MSDDRSRLNETNRSAELTEFPENPRSLQHQHKEALEECDRLIQHFRREATQHKRRFKRLRFWSVFLASAVTVLSALSASKKLDQWEWIVPSISGVATLCTTLLSQTNTQKVWIHSRGVQQKLQVERFLYLQNAGSYSSMSSDEERVCHFSNQIMNIWSEFHTTWEQNVGEGISIKATNNSPV